MLLALALAGNAAAAQDSPNFSVSTFHVVFADPHLADGLARALTEEARSDAVLAQGEHFIEYDIIGPGGEAHRLLHPEDGLLPDSETMTPLCGVETGQRLWLVTPDDGSGTPLDWTRQVMVTRDGPPMRIYARLGPYADLILSRVAAQQGVEIEVFGANSDAEALMSAKRAGHGFALIDARNANARGFGLVLDLNGPGTTDAPGVVDLGVTALPDPVLTVNVTHDAVDLARAAANRACAGFADQALTQEQVYEWQAALYALADAAGRIEAQ